MGFFNKIRESKAVNSTISEVSSLCFDNAFGRVYAIAMYSKIMYACSKRAMIPESVDKNGYLLTVHNSYSPYKKGLVEWVVETMVDSQHIYLRKIRIADSTYTFEKVDQTVVNSMGDEIDSDIVELDFREFKEAVIVKLLFSLLANVMQTISNNVTVSGALVFKIHKLSEMIANAQNKEPFLEQLTQINEGLTQGRPGYLDAESDIMFPSYDSKPAETSIKFIFSMISSITGLPNSYIFGEVVGGLGDNSTSDQQRFDTAIETYFLSIYSGVLYSVFDHVFDFKQSTGDINSLISAFAFIETTTLLNDAGKLKFMINNTGMDESDFNL